MSDVLREWIEAFVLSGRKLAGGCKQVGGPDICILRLFQRFVINHDRNDGSKHFCDPECVPHAIRTHKTGQKICGGHDNDHVAEKRNNKGLGTFSKAFQGTGGSNGYSGNQETGADDLQGSGACGNGFRVVVKSPISCPDARRQITVPKSMITQLDSRVSRKIFFTRFISRAPKL